MKAMTNEMKNMEVEHQAGPNEQLLQMVEGISFKFDNS